MAITPETFGEDEKEELLESVVWYTPTSEIGRKQLTALLKVLQELLKHKSEQVESLMSALDELAAKQGEEVARGRQEMLDEIEDLREQLEYQKRLERDSGVSDDQLRSEVVRLEMQNEELVSELQEREKDLVVEKTETERLIGQVAQLEREKLELTRELSAYQEESSDRRGYSIPDSPDGSTEKVEELVEIVRQKNKHIMQLLDDVEAVEQDNKTLRIKLTTTRNELTDANNAVAELTQQITATKIALDDAQRKCYETEEKNKALASQVDELIEKKTKNDRDLDEFALKLNERVEEWKMLLDSKDLEIGQLKQEVEKCMTMITPWIGGNVESEVPLRLLQQEQEISKLNNIISELKLEKNEYLSTIKQLQDKMSSSVEDADATVTIARLQEVLKSLESQLIMVEEDALKKAEEISDLIVQVRTYEKREFGLPEAMEKVKKLEKRLQERDSRIESLVAACNKLGIERGNLEDENAYLREKLGLSPSHTIDSGSVKSKSQSHAKTINDFKVQVERLNNEIIELKLENREIKSQLKRELEIEKKKEPVIESTLQTMQSKQDDLQERNDLQRRYFEVVEENDALRKGMHEILDSLQNQTLGQLEAKSLERLLEALDARHVSGWYHPAMRLQAQLHSVQGECREVRSQVGILRKENLSLSHDLEAAKAVIAALDDQLRQIHPIQDSSNEDDNQPKPYVDVEMERKCADLEIALRELKLCWDKAEANWESERRGLIKQRDALLVQLGAGVESDRSSEAIQAIVIEFMTSREERLEKELDQLRENFIKMEQDSLTKISSLEKAKSLFLLQIRTMEKQMMVQEPAEKVTALEKDLALLKIKYNVAMAQAGNKQKKTPCVADEPSFDQTEREAMLDEMKKLKGKLHDFEAQLNCYGENVVTPDTFNNQLTILSNKLAASEVQISSEKTKRAALERCYESVKMVQVENKEQITDLLQQVRDLSALNSSLQEALIEVESQLGNDTKMGRREDAVSELEAKCETLLLEKRNAEELLEMSRSQCRSLQSWKNSKSMERDTLIECLRVMEDNGDEKLFALRLSQELLAERTRCLEISRKNENAQAIISQLLSDNIDKETKIYNLLNQARLAKTQNVQHFKILYQLLIRLHSVCNEAFCFPTLDRALKVMSELEQQQNDVQKEQEAVEKMQQELRVKDDEMQVQLDALHDLKAAFQSDTKNLVSWHNKTTELRLKESRYKRQNQYLTEQVQKLDELVRRLKNEIVELEERAIEREREWEDRLKRWEYAQQALCQLVDGKAELSSGKEKENSEISVLERKVTRLQQEHSMLVEEMEQKEAVFREKLSEKVLVFRPKSAQETAREVNPCETEVQDEESEKRALMVTVNSLQAIIKQKEVAVSRYQELMKKSRQEHAGAIRRLQNELRNVHNALAMQSKAYSRLKHGIYQPAAADVEKYVMKIQELEEELTEVQGNMTRVSNQLKIGQQEIEKWRKLAEEREASIDESQERMETEIDQYREEAQNYQLEAQQLRELAQGGQTKMLIDTISELQKKLSQYGERTSRPSSARNTTENEERRELTSREPLRTQLKASREECARLRDQVKALKGLKRRPSSARVPENKENLVDKIRKLEEMLELSKQHEQELEEKGLKRIRSVEEVTRWDERKRFQKTLEKLEAKLKQREVEATVAVNKLETMRGLMSKMERDKAVLESHVKSLTESARESSRMEKLMTEKATLGAQVAALEEDLVALRRHEGGKAAAILHTKLEEQERQITHLQLANQAPKVLAAELDRLQANLSSVENKNLLLEAENSTLKHNLERLRDENDQLRKTCRRLEAQSKTNLSSSLRNSPSRTQVKTSYEVQRELSKMKEDLKLTRDRLSITVERNADLEQEIQRLRSQLSLWEEKDLADTLARTNQQQMISELHQELILVKSQLAHKVHLLERVKILLNKAAAKEKALNEKVFALQSMVPPGSSS